MSTKEQSGLAGSEQGAELARRHLEAESRQGAERLESIWKPDLDRDLNQIQTRNQLKRMM